MSHRKARKRKKPINIIFMILLLYIFLRPIVDIVSGGPKTILAQGEVLIDKINGEGTFIRSEKVVYSDVEGILNINAPEGEMLSAGQEVASIHRTKNNASLENEIKEIEDAISTLKSSDIKIDFLENEKSNIKDLKINATKKLQEYILNKDYENIAIIKEELLLYEEKQNDFNFSGSLASESINNLENKKQDIESKLEKNNIKYYTSNSGIVSYKVDGYESIYLPVNFENYSYKKLNIDIQAKNKISKDKKAKNENVSIGGPVYKLLDNFEWYVAIKIDNKKDVKDLDIGKAVSIVTMDKPEVKGKIIAINRSNDKAVLVIKFDTMLYKYYDIRFSDVQVIKSSVETLKLPKRSVVEKDNVQGVYIKNKSGIVEFRHIFKIKEDDEYIYIKAGDNSSKVYIKKDQDPVSTVTLFDEIILNTRNIQEGDIVN